MCSSPIKVISHQNPGLIRQRLPIVFAVLVGLLFPCGVAWLLRAQIERGDTDFSAFYTAGKMVAAGEGGRLYDSPAQLLAEIKYTGRVSLLALRTVRLKPFYSFRFLICPTQRRSGPGGSAI